MFPIHDAGNFLFLDKMPAPIRPFLDQPIAAEQDGIPRLQEHPLSRPGFRFILPGRQVQTKVDLHLAVGADRTHERLGVHGPGRLRRAHPSRANHFPLPRVIHRDLTRLSAADEVGAAVAHRSQI